MSNNTRTETFPVNGPINLAGRAGHGSFTVHSRDDITEAIVELVPRGAASDVTERTVVAMRGSTLVVQAPRQGGLFDLIGGRTRDSMDITVTLPSGSAVKISSFTADITVDGRCGTADLAAGSATITAEYVDGDLRVRYGSGNTIVETVSGAVQARSGSGDARFGRVNGALTTATGSGNLDVAEAFGPVHCRAGSGRATLNSVHGDVDAVTGSGTLAIGLPAGQAARLDVTTGSGRVVSELPIDDAPATSDRAITVRARTGSGNVRLFRAA
jgi:Putative adhesin